LYTLIVLSLLLFSVKNGTWATTEAARCATGGGLTLTTSCSSAPLASASPAPRARHQLSGGTAITPARPHAPAGWRRHMPHMASHACLRYLVTSHACLTASHACLTASIACLARAAHALARDREPRTLRNSHQGLARLSEKDAKLAQKLSQH
jgi:hypothetical protein